ncbi:hypothetical protein C2869_10095 [Saccharobesus litoralis]|uniref:Membrane protein involved in the export of O-antigen and teichoic acid n=1 Tax=Saccharobesus litoralis TaxID=2172099 RepID=A0A2S0VRB8_9ALTE|nr:hypothetical protein [Saccharobesus litoralis]AWB66753.1 hypothetical protein C2869_10095 [Saccharobesus litoralis]
MLKSIVQLASGNGIAQFAAFLSAPLLTRYYGADVIGAFGLMAAVSGVLLPLFTLRLELSFPSETLKSNVISGCSTIFSISLLLAVLYYFLYALSFFYLEMDLKLLALGFVPIWCIWLGFSQAFTYIFVKDGEFTKLSFFNVLRGGIQNTIVFAPLYFSSHFFVFIGSKIVGAALLLGWLSLQLKLKLIDFVPMRINFKYIARRKDFALHGTFQAVLNGIGSYLPQFVFALQFPVAALGQLAMAFFIVQAPTGLFSQAIRHVFHHKLAELYANSRSSLLVFYIKNVVILLVLYLIGVIVYWLFLKGIILWYLGEGWGDAYEYSKWLVLWFGLTVINPLPTIIIQLSKRQKILTVYEITYTLSRLFCVVLIIKIMNLTDVDMVKYLSCIGFGFNLVLIVIGCKLILEDRNE